MSCNDDHDQFFHVRFQSGKRSAEEMLRVTSVLEEPEWDLRPGAKTRRLAAEALEAVFALHFESEEKIDQSFADRLREMGVASVAISLCHEVCTELGVDCVADLALVEEAHIHSESVSLSTHVKTQLTPQWREKFWKMCQSS